VSLKPESVEPAPGEAVAAAIHTVLRDSGRSAGPVEPSMLLAADLGLDSLDLAQAIVLLERTLGVDPFRAPPAATAAGGGATDRPRLRTVSDLIEIYTHALEPAPPPDP
jgi:acyl carrier protein